MLFLGGHAVAFKPFVEGGFIDVNPPPDFDHRSVKSVAFCVENPPPDLTLGHKRRLVCQLFYGPEIFVVDQPFALAFSKKRKEKREKFGQENFSLLLAPAQIAENIENSGA